jgi:hypothetical protein
VAPGDTIVLDAGVTYTGNFRIPAKTNPNNKWIYLVSSNLANLPQGQRVLPAGAVNMPKIVSPNVSQGAFLCGWCESLALCRNRGLFGINVQAEGLPNFYAYALIDKVTYPSVTLPDSIVFDRVYGHGDATHDVQRAISANYSNAALVNSYISDIHMAGTETQAFEAWESPGPFKIVNNYLEAAGENLMFDGAGGPNNKYVPSDIEVRGNYIFKPQSWVLSALLPSIKWW